jgi:hypothetical protein
LIIDHRTTSLLPRGITFSSVLQFFTVFDFFDFRRFSSEFIIYRYLAETLMHHYSCYLHKSTHCSGSANKIYIKMIVASYEAVKRISSNIGVCLQLCSCGNSKLGSGCQQYSNNHSSMMYGSNLGFVCYILDHRKRNFRNISLLIVCSVQSNSSISFSGLPWSHLSQALISF